MKAKQLMLGNYALYNGLAVRVRNIHDNVFLDGGDESVEVVYDDGVVVLVDPCSLEPIPITPEILEKNGFECRGAWCIPGEDFGLRQDGDSWGLLSYYAEYDALAFCHIEYVHELQHALSLCDIEYEVKL